MFASERKIMSAIAPDVEQERSKTSPRDTVPKVLLVIVGLLNFSAACWADDLSCNTAAQLVTGYQFAVSGQAGWEGRFNAVSATCNGIMVEGKRAQARLTVRAGALPASNRSIFGSGEPPRGVDPFSQKGDYVALGTPFEFSGEAFYLLYSTGWKLESFKPKEGRRLLTKEEVQYRNQAAHAQPGCRVEGSVTISIGGHLVYTGTEVALVSKGSAPNTYRVLVRDVYGLHDGDVDGRFLRCPQNVWNWLNGSATPSPTPATTNSTEQFKKNSPSVESTTSPADNPPKRNRTRTKNGYSYELE